MDETHDMSEASDAGIGGVGRVAARVLTAFIVAEYAALAGISALAVPYFQNIFMDFDAALPLPTMILIDGHMLIVGGYCVVALLAVIKDLLLPRPLDRVIVNLILFVGGFVSILFMWIALYLPLVTIIQSVTR